MTFAPSLRIARSRPFRAAAFALLAALLVSGLWAGRARAQGLEALTIESTNGPHVFQVETMRTAEEKQRGLMFRRHLPEDRGMLFDFGKPQAVSMWMKNTYIPLDMLFIGVDGRVISIAQNTEPMSETIIPSGGDAVGVLEINGGLSARLGMKPGDRVRHPIFPK
jgi:hypothetical protein